MFQNLALRLRIMRTLDLYFLVQFVNFFIFLVFVFLIFVVGNNVLYNLLNFILENKVPTDAALKIILYQVPAFTVYALPLASLASTLLCVSRMSKDSEMDVIRTSGVSFTRIFLPFIVFGAMASVVSFYMIERVVPWANHESSNLMRQFMVSEVAENFRSNVFFEGKNNKHFYFRTLDKKNKVIADISIYDRQNDKFPMQINAKSGTWNDIFLILRNGTVHKYDEDGRLTVDSSFETMNFNIEREMEEIFGTNKQSQEMTIKELADRIKIQRQSGISTSQSETDFHFKLSIPMASFICVLLAFPLSLKTGRSGMFMGLILCLLLVAGYYIGTVGFQALGQKGMLPPVLAAWLQNIIFVVISFFLVIFSKK